MKTLKQLLEKTDKPEPTAPIEPDSVTSYVPKTKDEKRFMDKHVVKKTDDVNGNGDDHFRASNIKAYDRAATRHGYNTKQDQEVYEDKQLKTLTQILGEKKLTSAEMKKREDVAQAMERDNPGMDKSKKMAIATATAKRVAEEAEQIDELSVQTMKSAKEKLSNRAHDAHMDGFKNVAMDYATRASKMKAAYRRKEVMAANKQRATNEEVDFDQLDEAARHDQYSTYHAGAKDMLKKLGVAIDAHKEAAMSPTDYNKEKGASMHSGHVYAMKNMHRTLQDMHDNLQQEVEYAQPPKLMKMKEETSLFENFADDIREQIEQVYEHLSDEHKQVMIEMIEAEQYDEIVEIVNEVLNG
jgi:hypothetical protein